jgi:inner membrane protein
VDFKSLNIPDNAIIRPGSLDIGITDMRGINKNIQIKWGDSALQVIPGLINKSLSASGVHAAVAVANESTLRFSYDIDLSGSESINFVPLGKETNVELASSWTSPSFNGAFLPDDRNINEKGFTAQWNVLQLNRNFPQQWINDQYSVEGSSFGVQLLTPVDTYQKSERSVKYAILFIGLTFLVFFFAEIMTGIRMHPVNYLLSGFALCIFYSLLTALAEQINFNLAYLIAGATIVMMIGAFTHSLYKKWQVTATVTSSLVALYAFLFVILQLMDYSLLFGNIGLVIILAIVMYFSRKIDWYSATRKTNN